MFQNKSKIFLFILLFYFKTLLLLLTKNKQFKINQLILNCLQIKKDSLYTSIKPIS